jgi:hypothetical protein
MVTMDAERDVLVARALQTRVDEIVEELRTCERRRAQAYAVADAMLDQFDHLTEQRFALSRAPWRVQEPSDAGDCSLYLAHLTDNICCGDTDHAQYLLDWMAHACQHPDRQAETAVVMRGREGTGKGVCAKYLGQLFGPHYVHISQARHLVGHFNAPLQQCSVLFADEAFFAGDRSHEGTLKYLITEPTLLPLLCF